MLQGAMVEIKTVYVDIDSRFCHWAGPAVYTKKMPNTLFGGASINSARGYIYMLRIFSENVKCYWWILGEF